MLLYRAEQHRCGVLKSPGEKIVSLIEEVRFASDSPLERGGFEPSVPVKKNRSG
jgi:hypothetical protein